MKRGQVTLFIIIAIVILFLFVWLFSMMWGSKGEMPEDQQAVFNYVSSCLKQVGEDSLVVFGKQGRLEHSNMYEPLNLEYYYDGASRVPRNEDVEIELARYVDDRLGQCINDFSGFPVLNFTYISAPDSSVSIGADDITFDLKYLVKFEKEFTEYILEDYSVKLDVPISQYLYSAEHWVNYYMQHGAIDASYELNGLRRLEVHQHESVLVLGLFDNSTLVAGEPYLISWAMAAS
ncbi:MAG: hypothetical protein ACE5FT_04700 [Candidatus Nanoarchaeia archaeon]